MKRVLIVGYYGFNNAGDEMILASMLDSVRREEGAVPVVLSGNPSATGKDFGVESYSRWNPFCVFREIFRSNVVVVGGGGLFQDQTSAISLYYYLLYIVFGKILRKKVFVRSVGIGPLCSRLNAFAAAKMISFADSITVRDRLSYEWLNSRARLGGKLCLDVDPVLLWDVLKSSEGCKDVVAICLKGTLLVNEVDLLVKRVNEFVHNKGRLKVVLVPFYPAQDMDVCVRIGAVNKVRVFEWHGVNDLAVFFNEKVCFCLSMRFHGVLLAYKLGMPMAGIIEKRSNVPDKIERFLKDVSSDNLIVLKKNGSSVPTVQF